MKLRRSIAIDRPRGVVLESRGDEFAGRLRGMDIADPRLRVSLKFLQRRAYTLPMGLPHPIIAAHKRGNRYRLRRRERGVPPGAVLDAGDLSAKFAYLHEIMGGNENLIAYLRRCAGKPSKARQSNGNLWRRMTTMLTHYGLTFSTGIRQSGEGFQGSFACRHSAQRCATASQRSSHKVRRVYVAEHQGGTSQGSALR